MITVDRSRCVGCGECENACSFGAITLKDGIAEVDQDACTHCGACIEACPEGAISGGGDDRDEAGDLSGWKGIWIVSEWKKGPGFSPVTHELLGKARELADKRKAPLTAVIMGSDVAGSAPDLIAHGADRCLVVDHPGLSDFTDEVYANVLAELIRRERPEIVLAGATPMGRAYIPRVATLLETGLTADCTSLDIRQEDGVLLQTRPAWGGNLMATIVCEQHRPQMATVRPYVFKAMEADRGRTGEIVKVSPSDALLKSRVTVTERFFEEHTGPSLQGACTVIAAGRGLETEKNVGMVHELASLLGGAVGSTRAVTDAGWLPERTQIGQTGVTVSPRLYIGCGVSGAIQHVVGMQGSEIVVAVNKDPSAPIFDLATYGIVGDVKEILPLLISKIRSERGN